MFGLGASCCVRQKNVRHSFASLVGSPQIFSDIFELYICKCVSIYVILYKYVPEDTPAVSFRSFSPNLTHPPFSTKPNRRAIVRWNANLGPPWLSSKQTMQIGGQGQREKKQPLTRQEFFLMCLQDGPFWAKFWLEIVPINGIFFFENSFHLCYFTSEISGVIFKCNLRPIKRLTQPSNPQSLENFQPQKKSQKPKKNDFQPNPPTLRTSFETPSDTGTTWSRLRA